MVGGHEATPPPGTVGPVSVVPMGAAAEGEQVIPPPLSDTGERRPYSTARRVGQPVKVATSDQ